MFGWFRRNSKKPKWASHELANGWFTIALPASWEMTATDIYTTFDDPLGAASVGIIISIRGGMTLGNFAGACFSSKSAPLEPVGSELPFPGKGWAEGVSRDFIDTSSVDPSESIQRVACVRAADLYAKVTFYSSESWFKGPDYARVVASIRLVAMSVVAGP